MKTLADFKRRLIKGVVVEKTYHLQGKLIVHGNLSATTMEAPPKTIKQRVKFAQSASVGFELLEGPKTGDTTWLYYPKAKDFRAVDENTAEIWEDDTLILTYRFI